MLSHAMLSHPIVSRVWRGYDVVVTVGDGGKERHGCNICTMTTASCRPFT